MNWKPNRCHPGAGEPVTHAVDLAVPDIGDFKDIPIIEVLVKVGDSVELGDTLVTLESDKATLDVPAEIPGRISAIKVASGDRVSKGSLLLTLEPENSQAHIPNVGSSTQHFAAGTAAGAPVPSLFTVFGDEQNGTSPVISTVVAEDPTDGILRAQRPSAPPGLTLVPPSREFASSGGDRFHASPSIRRAARELAIDLSRVQGSGPRGRVLKSDLQNYVRAVMSIPPAKTAEESVPAVAARSAIDFSKFGVIERQSLSRIRRISGVALAHNWSTIPHVTNFEEADITDLDRLRAELNSQSKSDPKITLVSFLVKACAATLRAFPSVNASLDGSEVVFKKYVHVGVAVDTPGGLLVPVVRNADQLGVREIASIIAARAAEAKEGKLKASQMEGGCFTISSLGGIGNTGFTPIINAPEVAILGVCKAAIQPRWDGKQFLPRQILPLALSWDHRVLDGVEAARFLVHLSVLLQDFRRVSL
jgi:pyruvate dehydrogenase E2 component (dihydrolipoamide acetyltransferase)